MRHLNIDIETFSDIDIGKCGLYKYAEADCFEVLLFAYAWDLGEVHVVDLANGEAIPEDVVQGLSDENVIKHAYNAAFEITCLNRAGYHTPPEQWHCTMLHGLYLGYPAGLSKLGEALGLPDDKRKLSTGKALIKYFCVPCSPTKSNGGRTRNLPKHDTAKWELFKEYNRMDVVTEIEDYKRLSAFPVPDEVQQDWIIDLKINSTGVAIDKDLLDGALAIDAEHKEQLLNRAIELTGLSNPNSRSQLLDWINKNTSVELPDITKATVAANLDTKDEKLAEILKLRIELGKSSVSKYQAMERAMCKDGRVRGLLQYYGANRTGRWAGRLVQVQNLPRNYIETLDEARTLIKARNAEGIELLYGNVSDTLSQLIRTAFVAPEGTRFCVADFSAIEARVISWLAKEKWRMDVFNSGGDIYCMCASSMFGVPVEKHGANSHLRQKGKVAELACIAEGQLVQTDVGLVPIENVSLDMKIFDGVTFVSHDGVVYKGEKEVISYDGLTATADHLVWVWGEYKPIPFGVAATSGARLRKYKSVRQMLRTGKDNFIRTPLHSRLVRSLRLNRVPRLSPNILAETSKSDAGEVKGLPTLLTAKTSTELVKQALYCGKATMHKSKGPKFQKLRSKRDSILLQLSIRGGTLDDRELWSSRQDYGAGPNRCQRQLRAGESSLGDASAELSEPKTVSKVRTFDILNCGPRHRFVVSDCLVHNCGYQGGPAALTAMGALDMGLTEDELPDIVNRWRNANPNICKLWGMAEEAAYGAVIEGGQRIVPNVATFRREASAVYGIDFLTVELPSGRKLYYPSPRIAENRFGRYAIHYKAMTQTSGKWEEASTYGGKLVENITQAFARDCLAVAIRRLVEEGYKPLMHIHDEVVCEVPLDKLHEDEVDRMSEIMCRPIKWAPGLKLNAAGFDGPYYKKD